MAKKKRPEDVLMQVKIEYISNPKMSYRKLAEKYGVPLKKISELGKKEGWVQLRRQTGDKILKKTINRLSTEKADELAGIITTATKVIRKIDKTIDEDEKQFNRYIVNENFKAKEKIFKKMDTRAIRDIATTLKDLAAVVSLSNNKEEQNDNIEIVFKDIEESLNE
ncbi:MAG: hypothetical protein KHW49_02830 [Eubacterium sp.]|jgi:hypothetical protein|nr:hypothetical protein [Eubacterium sp.]